MAESLTQVQLATDEVNIVVDTVPQHLPCEIVMETAPRPLLLIQITGLDPWIALRPQRKFELQLVRAGITCNAFIASSTDGVISFTPHTEPVTVGASQSLTCVSFDLINFPHFWAMDSPTTKLPDDHLDIRAGDWELYVRPQRQTDETAVFRSTLYAVTHSCTLRRNALFTSDDTQAFLALLHDALSFAAGQWVGQVFVRGFDQDERQVWEQWGTGRLHPHLGPGHTWFDLHHGHALAALLPGMLAVHRDETRAKNMHSAIYWYIRASGVAPGVDGGIILLQAALELLAWQYFILDRHAPAPKQFLKTPASDRMRLLLQACGIPINIPTELTDLASVAAQRHWQDGPKALAGVRNQLVHPGTHQGMPYYDAWRLAEWYVELVLLHMLSFQGEYSNRIKHRWVGEVERVPWA